MSKTDSESQIEISSLLPAHPLLIQHHGKGANGIYGPMKEWAQLKKVPPVLLITGASGIGKRNLAYFLAQWLLCERSGFIESEEESLSLFGEATPSAPPTPTSTSTSNDPGPCGECPNCHRALKGHWVDFLEITPDDPESETLKIDQFRELKSKAGFGAHEGAYRIVLIPHADHMTVQAANSMLKLLEEPPHRWIFFLTASDPTLLLPTIVSRCQILRLKPFPAETITSLLLQGGVPQERAQITSHLAQGSWGKGWELAQEEKWSRRQAVFDFISDPATQLAPLLDWAAINQHSFNFLVDQLEQITTDLVRYSLEATPPTPESYSWKNTDGAPALVRHVKMARQQLGPLEKVRHFWLDRAERLAQARQDSGIPLNRKILTQDILLPWLTIHG